MTMTSPATPAASASRRFVTWGALVVASVALLVLGSLYLPQGIDWTLTFRPGALAMLRGESPYAAIPIYSAPPWTTLVLIPLAVLPEAVGRALLLAASLAALAYAAWRLGASPLALAVFVLSPPVLHCLLNANLDFVVVLGFVLPPPVGLFFIATKPQVGSVVGLFWCVEAWRKGGWRGLLRVAGPVAVAYLISFALYGFWPSHYLSIARTSETWNASLWPLGIPIGLALTVQALRTRLVRWAMPASVCLSPYVLFHSYSAALVALVRQVPLLIAAVVGLWIAVVVRVLGF